MSKFILTGVITVAIFGAIALFGYSTVSAYQGDPTKVGPNHTEEREDAMEDVMAKKDFEGWKKLMTADGRSPGVLRKIDTQEEFNLFAEMYKLQHEGKDASALRQQLGLGNGGMRGTGGNGGQGCGQ